MQHYDDAPVAKERRKHTLMPSGEQKATRFQFRLIDLLAWVVIAAFASLFLRDFGGGGLGIIIGVMVGFQIGWRFRPILLWISLGVCFGAILGAFAGFAIEIYLS